MLKLLLTAILSWLIFNAIYWPLEYVLIQRCYLSETIIPYLSTSFLLGLVLIWGWIYISWQQRIKVKVILGVTAVALILAATSYQFFYRQTKDFFKQPVIHARNPNWSIQDSKLVITGNRLINDGRKGKFTIGQEEVLIDEWSDNKIVGHLPVPKNPKTPLKMRIIRADGLESNSLDFYWADPDEIEELSR